MKYLLLLYAEPGVWPPKEHEAALTESIALCHRLQEQGKYVAAAPLDPAAPSACVQVRNGQTIVTDGPYSETKEQLGGYFLIEAASPEEAVEIAAQVPGARRGTAEIRPLLELPSLPS